jgi:hypothetical protein
LGGYGHGGLQGLGEGVCVPRFGESIDGIEQEAEPLASRRDGRAIIVTIPELLDGLTRKLEGLGNVDSLRDAVLLDSTELAQGLLCNERSEKASEGFLLV